MVRHNSNKLEPDPFIVDRLSLLAWRVFKNLSGWCTKLPLAFINP